MPCLKIYTHVSKDIYFSFQKKTIHTQLGYYCGEQWVKEGRMDGFNIGQNIGAAAGQTIFWPHIHFIPRKNGDSDGKHNGIRLSHPNGDHKEYY